MTVAATFGQWPQTATIPPGLLIPRSQVRSLPGPLRAEVRPLRGHDDFRAFELESGSRVADVGKAVIGVAASWAKASDLNLHAFGPPSAHTSQSPKMGQTPHDAERFGV